MTCLANTAACRRRFGEEGGRGRGDREGWEGEGGVGGEFHMITILVEKITLGENRVEESKTLSTVLYQLGNK